MVDLRSVASRLTPQPLGKAIYYSGFIPLKTFLSVTHPNLNISIRNSFLSTAFSTFVSDMDLTVLFPDDYNLNKTRNALRAIQRYRNFFPVLGEINSYSWSEIEKFRFYLNPFEGARDPILRPFLKQNPTWADKFVFLLRMIEADASNLLYRPVLRKKKWERHFSACEILLPSEFSLEILVKTIADALLPQHALEVSESTVQYLELIDRGITYDKIDLNPALWAMFPNRFCFDSRAGIELSEALKQIQEAQVQWEIWGLMSQRRSYELKSIKDRRGFQQHIDNLVTAFPQFSYIKEFKKHISNENI